MSAYDDDENDDGEDASAGALGEFVTVRLRPETAELFCDALEAYAGKLRKSQKEKTRALADVVLTWRDRLKYETDEIVDDEDED